MEKIIFFIEHSESFVFFFYLKIIFIALAFIIFVCIVILLLKNSWLKHRILANLTEFITYRPFGAKKIFKQWLKISKRLEIGKEAEYKLALIEADSLLDEILKKIGYKGETTGELLKQLDSAILPNIEQVWEAHKTRNNVVHDPDYHLSLEQAKKTLGIYEQALRDLEMF